MGLAIATSVLGSTELSYGVFSEREGWKVVKFRSLGGFWDSRVKVVKFCTPFFNG